MCRLKKSIFRNDIGIHCYQIVIGCLQFDQLPWEAWAAQTVKCADCPAVAATLLRRSQEETKGTTLRRSLSVGAVGVIMSGAVFATANATNNEAPQTTVDNGAVVAAPQLKAFAIAGEGKIGIWGVPEYVVAPEKPVESTPEIDEKAAEDEKAAAEAAAAEAAAAEEVNLAVQSNAVEVIEAAPVEVAPVQEVAPVEVAPVQEYAAPVEEAAPAPTLAVATNQAKRDAVVAAAMAAASVNAQTDCTALATNSLSAVGINFHGWPMDYMALGTVTYNPQPGDLVLYSSNGFGQQHIAVYIGNGQAVHGGWNGMGTSVFSVNLPTASAPIFVTPAGYNG